MQAIDHLRDHFLQPGEWYVGDAGDQIRTVLGSCVSVSLWHPALRIGGMVHYLLPTRGGVPAGEALDGRYGDEALRLMFDALQVRGVPVIECQAKIFGGGNMFPDHVRAGASHVGQRNGEAARSLLQQYGISVLSESLYGVGHRQIIFDVSTGDVWANQIKPAARDVVAEERYA